LARAAPAQPQGLSDGAIEFVEEGLSEAFDALRRAEWAESLEIAAMVQEESRRLLAGSPGAAAVDRQRLAELGATAEWVAAKSEHGLGDTPAALRRLAMSGPAWSEAGEGARSLALSLQATLLVDLGLPDLATEPLRRARSLVDAELERGQRRNLGAYFDAYLGEVERSLAIGRFADAIDLAESLQRRIDWQATAAAMRPGEAVRRRRELELLRAAAGVELAVTVPEAGPTARTVLEQALAGEGWAPLEGFSARTKLVQLDLLEGALEAADARLRELDLWLEGGALRALPPQERVWRATLRAELARRLGRGRTEALAELRGEFAALCAGWRAVALPGGVGFLRYARVRAALLELLMDGSDDAALQTLIDAQHLGSVWQGMGAPTVSAAEVRATLCPPGSGCLVFVTGAQRSLLVAFDGQTIRRFASLPGYAWIESRRRDLAAALAASGSRGGGPPTPRSPALAKAAGELADGLFPEGARELLLRWRRAHIVGRDLLAGVPLQLLPVLDSKPFGVSHALADLPSLPVGVALARRRGAQERGGARVGLLAAPRPAREVVAAFPILGERVVEPRHVEPLVEHLGSRLVGRWEGEEATLGAAARARETANVLHVVAHGLIDGKLDLLPVVALTPDKLAPDGLMTVERASRLQVPELVFFSSCRTSGSQDRFGDAGANHLGGAMLLAGAASVVVSDEDLDLADAIELALEFYASYEPRAGPAEALRAAGAALHARGEMPRAWARSYIWGLGD
jgi:hypothetical protein